MSTKEFHLLINHEAWANKRVAESFLQTESIPIKAINIFNHIIGAQDAWISRIKMQVPTLSIWPELNKASWIELIEQNRKSLFEIYASEKDMDRLVTYKNSAGQEFSNPISEILLHLMLHSQYHRGQVIAYSVDIFAKPPVTDMIAYLRLT